MVSVLQALKARECGRNTLSLKDSITAAGVLVLGSFAIAAIKIWLRSAGQPEVGRQIADLGFPLLYIFVTNVWYLRGQSGRARLVLSGVLVAIFGLAFLIAALI